ncbi:MAG: DsrE family protein [Actinomycetota bacterium]
MASTFVLRLTRGSSDPEPVGQALTIASTALVSGVAVELWLMAEGVELARPGAIEKLTLAHSPPLIELWDTVRAAGPIYACTQCLKRRGMDVEDLREGVTQAGAQAFVASLAADGATCLDF